MSGITPIPYGELAGFPAVKIIVPPIPDKEFLVRKYVQASRPGVSAVHIETDAWGSPEFETALGFFLSDARTHSAAVWATRSASEEGWSATPIWNVVDCSAFVAAPATTDVLIQSLMAAPFIPRPTELLITDPDEACILPAFLDEFTTRLDPERGGWIYLTDPSPRVYQRAVSAMANATPGWGVRIITETP